MKALDVFKVLWTAWCLFLGWCSFPAASAAAYYCPIFQVKNGAHAGMVVMVIGWLVIMVWACTIPWWDWKEKN